MVRYRTARKGELPGRTTGHSLRDMFIRLQSDPVSDAAVEFRDRVRGLGIPERPVIEAAHVRIMLTRASRVGLRERLNHGAPRDRSRPTRIGRGVAG